MTPPLVSVIVLFGRGEFEPCLGSLIAQAGIAFEIIGVVPADKAVGQTFLSVPSGNSSVPSDNRDQSGMDRQECLSYCADGGAPADPRVRIIRAANPNPAFRRNLAADQAQGRYLAFIDDDATAPPDWLKKAVAFLEDHPLWAGVGGPNLCPADSRPLELLTDLVLTTPLIGAGSRAYRGGG